MHPSEAHLSSRRSRLYMLMPFLFTMTISSAAFPADTDTEREPAARRHHVGIFGKLQLYYGLDKTVSPRRYLGPLYGGLLSYEYRSERNIHTLFLSGGVGSPKARTTTVIAHRDNDGDLNTEDADPFVARGQLQYAYHRILKQFGAIGLGLGGALDAEINYFNATSFSWLSAYSLNLSVLATWQVHPKHQLVFRAYTPLLTFLARPAWSVFDDSVMERDPTAANLFVSEFTSIHEFARITAEVKYELTVSPLFKLGVVYEIAYEQARVPHRADILCNSVALGVVPTI